MATIPPPSENHYLPNVQSNSLALHYVKSTTSSLAGATAGLLGLTNLSGFAFYVLTSLLIGSLFSAANCRGKPGQFFAKGREVVVGGLLDNAFAFVLFWTLFYALVHIYD